MELWIAIKDYQMNKIFKVIFNKTTQRFVVVSELGKCTNRNKSQILIKTPSSLTQISHFIFTFTLAASIQSAMADSVAISQNQMVAWANSGDAAVKGNAVASGENSVAVGNNSRSGGIVSVAVGSLANSSGYGSVSIGNASHSKGAYSTALGGDAQAVGFNSTALGNTSSALSKNTVAIGYSANAILENATAVGENSQASAVNSSAFGHSAVASGHNSLAMGISAQASAWDTIALGSLAKALHQNAIAIGANALAQGAESIAQGSEARAMMDQSIAIGYNANAESNNKQDSRGIAIGYNTHAENEAALALGNSSIATADSSTAIGRGTIAAGDAAIAIGNYTSQVIKNYGDIQHVPLRFRTIATGAHSLALGSFAHATVDDSIALGSGSIANRHKGFEGYDVSASPNTGTSQNSQNLSPTWRATRAALSIGNGSQITRQITGVAAGTKDTDAVNVAQLKRVKSQYVADNGTLISRKPNEVLSLIGGAETGVADSIKTTGNANGTIHFQVSNMLNGMNKITFGMPNQNNSDDTVSISTNGISAGNKVISNVASGGRTTTNAANIGDVQNAIKPIKTELAQNKNEISTNFQNININKGSIAENIKSIQSNASKITTNENSINDIHTSLEEGISFRGDTGEVNKKLGETLEFVGGSKQTDLTKGNIGVNVENGKIDIQLTKDIKGLSSISVGDTKINTQGITIIGGPALTTSGIDAGNKVISNVASGGKTATNAANIGDVQNAVNPIQEATQVNHQNITKLQNETLQLGAGDSTVTDPQKLSKVGGLKFDIVGEDGINTTATGNEIQVSLDKDSVRHLAQEAVKVIDGTHTTVTTGKAGNATTYQINVETDGKVVNGNEGIVTGGAVKTALDNQVIGYSANKKADATQAQQTIKLSQGLDFINGTNTTAKVETGGKVTYNVNANLTGMSSIAGNGSKIIFNKDGITLGDSAHQAPIVLHGVKAGEQNTDAANVGQLTKVKGTTGQLDVGISGTTATGKTYTISLDPAVTQHIQTNTIEAKKHSSVVAEGNGLTVTNTTENSAGGTEYKVALKLGDVASTNTTQAVSGSAVKTYVDAQEFGLTAGDNNTLSHHLGNAISVKGADNQANIVTKIENGALTIGLTKAAQDKLQQADINKNSIANIGDIVGENGITVTGNANVKNGAVTLKLNDNVVRGLAKEAVKVTHGKNTMVTTSTVGDTTAYAVNVITDGQVEAGNNGIVTGNTVHAALMPIAKDIAENKTQIQQNAHTINQGLQFGADSATATGANPVTNKLGSQIDIKGDGKNIHTTVAQTINNGKTDTIISVNLAKNLTDLSGVHIANGPSMTAAGVNAGDKQITHVASGLQGQSIDKATGSTLQNAANIGDIQTAIKPIEQDVATNKQDITTNKTTIVRNTQRIDTVQSTLNKGLSFTADSGNVNKQLGDTLHFAGGADKAKLTDHNIGVNVENGVIQIQLAKNLTGLDSVTVGNTKLDNTGIAITGGPSMTSTGINAGDKQITDVASGLGQGQTLENADQATLRHAANIADLKQAVTTVKTDMSNQTLAYSANNTAAKPQKTVKLSEGLNFFNGSNTTVTVADNGKVTYNLNSALTNIQSVSGENAQIALGKNGITVGDKAHAPVAIHGVKAGQEQTDATNVGQLTKVEGQSKEVIVKGTANATGGTTYHVSLAPNVAQAIADNKAEAAKHSEVISENHSLNITADKTTATGGKIYNVEVATTDLNVANGKVVMPSHQAENNADVAETNKFVTAGNMANVLNNIGFTLQAQGKNGSLIKAGSQVNLANTDGNIHIEKTATNGDVTFNLNKSLNLDAQNQGSVSGLQNHLMATTDSKAVSPTISTQIEHQAATVGDVLHAGWNIAQGTVNKGIINPYDTVSFANGNATTATVSTEKDGQVSVKYGVNVDDSTIKIKDGKLEAIIPKNTGIMELQVGADNTQNLATHKVAPITLDQKNHAISIWGTDNEVTTQVVGNNVKVALASKVKNELAKGLLHTTVSKGNNITITPTKATATQGANYQVSLNADLNGIASIRNGDTATGTQITLDAHNKNLDVHDAQISQIQSAIADQSGQSYLDKLYTAQNQATTAQDAVNVTDLANTATALNNTIANKVTNLEMQYQGDNTQVTVKRKPSEILTLNGGATSGLDDSIQTVGNANGSITFKVSKTLNGMNSITFEKTAGSQSNSSAVSIGKNGISAGDQQIKNVLSGGDIDTNAANIGDVKKAVAPVQQQVTQNKAGIELNTNALNKIGTVEIAGDGGLEITSANKNLKDGNITISLDSITVANHLMDSPVAKNALQAGLGDGENKVGNKGLINGNTLHTALGSISDGIKAQGLNFIGDNYQATDTDTQIHKPLGSTLTIVGGAPRNALTENNIGVNVENGEIKVQLAKELKGLLSVQAGNTILNEDGVIIKNGPSITNQGIDAGLNPIRNVSAGTITNNSKDAINGRQLKKLGVIIGLTTNATDTGFNLPHFHSLKNDEGLNTEAPISFTNAIDNLTDTVNKGFIFEANSTHVGKHGNKQYLGSTLDIVGSTIPRQDDNDYSSKNLTTEYIKDAHGNGKIIIKIDEKPTFKAVTLTNDTGVTVVSPDGLTIENQAGKSHISLTQQGLNNGGHVISNVHAGKNVTDAVNVGQLDYAKADLTNSGLQFGADKASTATGSNPVTNKLGSRVDIKGDDQNISTTVSQNAQASDTTINVKLAPKIDVESVHAKDDIQIGDNVTINRNGLTIKNGPSLTTAGLNNDNKQIINVASGLGDTKLSDAKGSMLTNAVNVGDLKQAVKEIDTHISDHVNNVGLKYKANDGKAHHLNLNNDVLTFADGKNTQATINANGEISYDVAPDLKGIKTISGSSEGAKISLSQKDKTISIHGGKLTDVAKGQVTKDSTDAVNGSQLFNTNQKVTENIARIQKNTAMLEHGISFVGNTGSGNQKLGSTFKIEGSRKDENATYSSDNITTTYQQDNQGNGVMKVEMKENPTFKSVDVAGNNGEESTHISSKGVTVKSADGKDQVSVTAKGLNNGGNVISNVADGKAPTDAVNRRQLDKVVKDVDILKKGIVGNVGRAISDMQQRISKNRKEANAGSAAAIAAANLPQSYLAGRSMVSAAVGSYHNQQAISIGISSISDNGKWVVKSSISEDTQHNFGVGAGIGYQW